MSVICKFEVNNYIYKLFVMSLIAYCYLQCSKYMGHSIISGNTGNNNKENMFATVKLLQWL